MITRSLTVLALLIVVGYGLWEAVPLLSGPRLSLTEPINSESFHTGLISISGTAVHTQKVTLDGGPLLTDPNGHFQTALTLPRGGAILTITATDRFGRSVTEHRAVFVP
jgi:hypothetical protein